jgi:hypothetical protein
MSSPANTVPDAFLSQIEGMLRRLQNGAVAEEEFAKLRQELSTDPRRSIAAITEFLKSGRDAPTGQEFIPGSGGELAGAPTLRVFLMDVLGTLNKQTRSGEAAAVAREVLQTKNSADEWAISLRNVAWQEPQSTGFLAGKMRELLRHEAWLKEPSGGMLEAFDVIVYTKDSSFVSDLAELGAGTNETLQRASAVALDRLSESAPLEVMNHLNSNPALLSDRPFARADYFTKADLSIPAQRQAVELYLSRADVTADEKSKLLKGLLTPGSFISDNLLTESAPPPEDSDARRLEVLQKTTADWLKAQRFPQISSDLQQLNSLLQQR